jgi:hypothetical protein
MTSSPSVAISATAITREAATQMAYDALFKGTTKTTGYAVYLKTWDAKTSTWSKSYVGTYASVTEAAAAANTLNTANNYTANIYSDRDDDSATPATLTNNGNYYYASTSSSDVYNDTLAYSVFGVTRDHRWQ